MENQLISIRFSDYPVENGQAVVAMLQVKSKEDGKAIVNQVCHYRGKYWSDFEKYVMYDSYRVGRLGVLERFIQMDLTISVPLDKGLNFIAKHLMEILS